MLASAMTASTSLVIVVPLGAVLVWLKVICMAIPSFCPIEIVITSSISFSSSIYPVPLKEVEKLKFGIDDIACPVYEGKSALVFMSF